MIRLTHKLLQALLLCIGLLMVQRASADTIDVTANMSGTVNWYNTNEYVLNGFIYVLEGGVLNIEPGTVIRGKAGTGLNSAALFITRGAKIFANGTAHSPIIFTSETDDLDDPNDIPIYARNLWGGVVIYGKATINTSSDVAGNAAAPKYDVFEGLPDSQVGTQFVNRFGGNDDNDSSGVMRYCSIRHSSTVILPNKEINALSLCAVGRGTTIENIEGFAAGDDSVEFFGGTVNTKYLVSIFSDDDNFDIDQGHRGHHQFWFALQAPDRKDQGGEWNGEPNGIAVNASPIGNFEIYNATYIGAGTNSSGGRAFISREYAAPRVFNSIFTEFNIGGNIDERSAVHFTNGIAKFANDIFWNFAANGTPAPYGQNDIALWALNDPANNNSFVDPMLRSISRTNVPAFGLDPRPRPGSPAAAGGLTAASAPNDGFYTPVSYKGAFSTNLNWASDWTFAAEAGLITGEGAGTPAASGPVTPVCLPADLEVVINGGNVNITFTAVAGVSYQVQSTTDLGANPIVWSDEGTPLSGTGTLSFSSSTGGGYKFFRVVCR